MDTLHKYIKLLAVLFLIQGLLAAVMWATGGRTPGDIPKPLLPFEESAVTALEITGKPPADGKPAESVKLVRKGSDWVVASAGDFPAKKDKVDEVLKKLLAIKIKTPIATQAANHNVLRVGKETYGKEVVVTAGGEGKKLVVGSGANNAINVRYADAAEVFQGRGISEYQLSNTPRSHVETQYVKTDSDKVAAVQITNAKGTLTFRKEGTKWLLEQLPAGAELDESKVTGFVNNVARITLDRPVGKEIKPEMGLGQGATVKVEATEDDKPVSIEYQIGAQAGASENDGFYLKAKDNEFVVVATKWATESARTKGVEDFVKKAEQAENAANPPDMPPGMPGLPPGMPMGFPPPGAGGPHDE